MFTGDDILGYKGPYEILRDQDRQTFFNKAILRLFEATEYSVITALIDKRWMVRQEHWERTHPYNYLMEILVEKYVQFLECQKTIGDIMPESRQGSDGALQNAYSIVYEKGCDYVKPQRIQSMLRAKKLKFRTKKENIAGLQLCDLLAHPSHIFVRGKMGHSVNLGRFSTQVCKILWDQKYDRSPFNGNIVGYGIKHLPR